MKPFLAIFEFSNTLITNYTFKNYPNKPIWFDLQNIVSKFKDLSDYGYEIILIGKNDKLVENAYKELNSKSKDLKLITYKIFTDILFKLQPIIFNKKRNLKEKNITSEFPSIFLCGDRTGEKEPYPKSSFDIDLAKKLKIDFIRAIDFIGTKPIHPPKHKPELILTMGMPGSGKSYNMFEYSQKYDYIQTCDNDINWKDPAGCVEKSLKQNRSVINITLGNTEDKRNRAIDVAKKYNIPYRIVWFIRDGRPFNQLRGKKENQSFLKGKTTFLHRKPVPNQFYIDYFNQFTYPNEEYEITF